MADRCTGRCCRDFIIRRSPEELKEDAETATPRWRKEYTKISEMTIHLRDDGLNYHHYTCKHFDTDTNNCTDYEDRPEMCRNFPYGDPCPFHDECEWNPDSPRPDVSLKKLRYSASRYRAASVTRPAPGTITEALEGLVDAVATRPKEEIEYRRPRCDQRHRREEKICHSLESASHHAATRNRGR